MKVTSTRWMWLGIRPCLDARTGGRAAASVELMTRCVVHPSSRGSRATFRSLWAGRDAASATFPPRRPASWDGGTSWPRPGGCWLRRAWSASSARVGSARPGWRCGWPTDLARGFADGGWWVSLAEVRDPDRWPRRVMTALDVHGPGRDGPAAAPDVPSPGQCAVAGAGQLRAPAVAAAARWSTSFSAQRRRSGCSSPAGSRCRCRGSTSCPVPPLGSPAGGRWPVAGPAAAERGGHAVRRARRSPHPGRSS